jgi:Flp pilus assembly pilin Flp
MLDLYRQNVAYARALTSRVRSPRAATMLEYVLIAGIVIGVATAVFIGFKSTITGWFNKTNTVVNTASEVAP